MSSRDIEYIFCGVIISRLEEQDVQVRRTQNSLDFFFFALCWVLGDLIHFKWMSHYSAFWKVPDVTAQESEIFLYYVLLLQQKELFKYLCRMQNILDDKGN